MVETRTETYPLLDRRSAGVEDPLRDARHGDARGGEAGDECGRRIGPYRLERLLGQGGTGEVYLAARTGDFEKRVALKLIQCGADCEEIEARFRAERQILARLEHPLIARILDGGTTGDGRPYLVMEYVDGEPLDRYCETHGLSLRQRLELFRQVCAAVAAAHRSLVVHRDLKPGNVLVTAGGTVKLLDFGIAKLLAPDPASTATDPGGPLLLTPGWASPEQLRGDPITTVTDVYSLGVVLYQLLAGRHPYPPELAGWQELVKQVCDREPPAPSTVAGCARKLAGDLDAIVGKAMRKQPERRYGSVERLSEDVRRHLAGLPVRAREGGWSYRAGKLVRRYKAALAMLLLVLGVGAATSVLWWRAERERAGAVRARSRAETVSVFLENLFATADPGAGAVVTVRQTLDSGRDQLAGELLDEPEIRAELLATLGLVYHKLYLYDDALELKEEALATRRVADPSDRHALAVDLNNLGRLFYDLGDHAAAGAYYRQALAMWERLGDTADAALALRNLAALEIKQGNTGEAVELYRRVLKIDLGLYPIGDPRVAASYYGLGAAYRRAGDPRRAEPLLRRALEITSRSLGGEHTRVVSIESSLGQVLHALGRLEEARDLLEGVVAARRRLFGDDHVRVAVSEKNLAALLLDFGGGGVAAGGELLERALVILRRVHPAGDARIADAESIWGSYLAAAGRRAEAEPVLLESLATLAEVHGEEDLRTRAARRRLAAFYQSGSR